MTNPPPPGGQTPDNPWQTGGPTPPQQQQSGEHPGGQAGQQPGQQAGQQPGQQPGQDAGQQDLWTQGGYGQGQQHGWGQQSWDQPTGQQSAGQQPGQQPGQQGWNQPTSQPSAGQQPGQQGWNQPSGQQSAGQTFGQQSANQAYGQQSANQAYGQQSAGQQAGQSYGQQPGGQGYTSWQTASGKRPIGDANPLKAAMDFGFQSYATPGLVKIIYILAVVLGALWWIGGTIVLFAAAASQPVIAGYSTGPSGSDFIPGILSLLLGWIPVLLWLLFVRVLLEAAMALVRTATDVRALRTEVDSRSSDS